MTSTEKALREALDTLVAVVGLTAFKYEGQRKPLQEAIDNARAALSLPETQGEPVAWMYVWPKNNLPYLTRHIYDERLSVEARAARAAVGVKEFPLYAAPPSQPAQGEPEGENLEALPPEVHEAINAYAAYYAEHHKLGMSIRKDMQYIASVALRFATPSQPAQGEPVAWADWKVGSNSYAPFRTLEEAQRSVRQSSIAATQEGPYEVVGLVPLSRAAPAAQPAQGWKLVPEEPPLVCLRHGMADITPPCRKWCGSASCTPPTQAKPTNGEGA